MMKKITLLLSTLRGTPSYIGSTDSGCLWGDFICVNVTDFEC